MTEEQRRRAIEMLNRAVQEHRGFAAVSRMLDISRAAVSCVARGVYPGDDGKVLRRVLDLFDRYDCPYLRQPITPEDCRSVWSGATPSHDPSLLAHRRACRGCVHRTEDQSS